MTPAAPRPLTLLTYEYPGDILERRGPHRDAHLDRISDWESDGRLLLAGAVGDPPTGAVFVFDCPSESVEEFAASDPYMEAGLVTSHSIDPLAAVAWGGSEGE